MYKKSVCSSNQVLRAAISVTDKENFTSCTCHRKSLLLKTCQKFKSEPPQTVLYPLKWPKQPWVKIHADFMGPFLGKLYVPHTH